jgi:hypothetical protein
LLELSVAQISNEQATEEPGIVESRCISRRDNLLQLAATRLILRTLSESQQTVCYYAIPHTKRVIMSPNDQVERPAPVSRAPDASKPHESEKSNETHRRWSRFARTLG